MLDLILAMALTQAPAPSPAPDPCHAVPQGATQRTCPAWRPFGDRGERQLFVDPASVRRDGAAFEIAMRTVYERAQPQDLRSIITVNRFDCARQTMGARHMTVYDSRGVFVARMEMTGADAVPEPLGNEGAFVALATEFCPSGTIAAPDPCYAADVATNRPGCPVWRLVHRDAAVAMFIRPDALDHSGQTLTISYRITFPSPQAGNISSGIVLADYDCAARTAAPVGLIAFDASGTRLPRRPVERALIQNESFDARILAEHCPR